MCGLGSESLREDEELGEGDGECVSIGSSNLGAPRVGRVSALISVDVQGI